MHDGSAVEVLSGAVEMLSEAMAEGAHSLGGVSWSAVDEGSRAQSWKSIASVRRPRTRFAHSAAAASFRSAAGFLPFATSPMTAAAASRAFDSESAEQEPNGTRHFWRLSVYWQR